MLYGTDTLELAYQVYDQMKDIARSRAAEQEVQAENRDFVPRGANLCGDLMNVTYLRQSCPEMEVVETGLKDRPAFLDGGVDLVYVGSATERGLRLMVQALTPYKAGAGALCGRRRPVLATGNALDALGEYVVIDGKRAFDGLGILPTHAEYHMMKRHNSFLLGSFQDMEIVGFKSLFGHTYPDDELANPLFRVERGVGRHPGAFAEGFLRGGLMATYLIGPLLPLNPPLHPVSAGADGSQGRAPGL